MTVESTDVFTFAENKQRDERINKQLNFYFSDANMPKDKFLLQESKKDSDGWVPLSLLISFKRMQQLLGIDEKNMNIAKDAAVSLCASVLRSMQPQADALLEVSEDGLQVRRSRPLPTDVDSDKRTLYVKFFSRSATLEDLESFLGPVTTPVAIRMRRFPTGEKGFRGSIFLELSSEEECARVSPILKEMSHENNTNLHVETKVEYLVRKKAETDAAPRKGKSTENSFTLDLSPERIAALCMTVVGVEGTVDPEVVSFRAIREAIEKYEIKTGYADFSSNPELGYVRLIEPNVDALLSKLRGAEAEESAPAVLKVTDSVSLTLRRLSNDECEAYIKLDAAARAVSNKGGKKGGKMQQRRTNPKRTGSNEQESVTKKQAISEDI